MAPPDQSRLEMAPPVAALARAFDAAGHRLYLVGGAVRNALLGRPDTDLDLTTDAVPPQIRLLVDRALTAASIYDVGERFGTIGVAAGEWKIEITTFRSEAYEPGSRKPAVTFGTSLEGDLARRDFTINAMARDLRTGALVDPFGGQRDLAARLIRAVGEPRERLAEDPLRMLRAVRFAVQLRFTIDPRTRAGIHASSDEIDTVSAERIRDELNQIMLSPEPARGIRTLVDLGLMRHIIPQLLDLRQVHEGRRAKDVFEHTMRVLDGTPANLRVRWAALLHDIAKPRTVVDAGGDVHFPGHEHVGEQMAREILSSLRFDRETVGAVATMVELHMRANQYDDEWNDGAVRRLVRDAGNRFEDLLQLSRSDVTSRFSPRVVAAERRIERLRERRAWLEEEARILAMTSPLDGNELMRLFGRKPGPWIGQVKDRLLADVIDGELAPDDKREAARRAAALLGEDPDEAENRLWSTITREAATFPLPGQGGEAGGLGEGQGEGESQGATG